MNGVPKTKLNSNSNLLFFIFYFNFFKFKKIGKNLKRAANLKSIFEKKSHVRDISSGKALEATVVKWSIIKILVYVPHHPDFQTADIID